jgi:hypothetical protein
VEKGVNNRLWTTVGDKDKAKNGEYYLPVGKGGGGQSSAGERIWRLWLEKLEEQMLRGINGGGTPREPDAATDFKGRFTLV